MRNPFIAILAALLPMAVAPALAQDNGHGDVVRIGTIEISGAFTRATLPNAPVGGGYLVLANRGDSDDRLIAATSPAAADVQMHEMAMENDVMRMRELPDGIVVPAGATVTLAPSGLHFMLMGLAGPLVEGTSIAVTLTFAQAGMVTIDMPVAAIAARSAPLHGGHDAHGTTSNGEAR